MRLTRWIGTHPHSGHLEDVLCVALKAKRWNQVHASTSLSRSTSIAGTRSKPLRPTIPHSGLQVKRHPYSHCRSADVGTRNELCVGRQVRASPCRFGTGKCTAVALSLDGTVFGRVEERARPRASGRSHLGVLPPRPCNSPDWYYFPTLQEDQTVVHWMWQNLGEPCLAANGGESQSRHNSPLYLL